MARYKTLLLFLLAVFLFINLKSSTGFAQATGDDLVLEDMTDLEMLMESIPSETAADPKERKSDEFISVDEVDDLENLKEDIGAVSFDLDAEIKRRDKLEAKKKKKTAKTKKAIVKKKSKKKTRKTVKKAQPKKELMPAVAPHIFDVGKEEKELLTIAEAIGSKIPDNEWNETVTKSQISTYSVIKGDWLFKISKRLFGSGFYYPKIWSLNPFITNPHEIEPGMILTFSTGNSMDPPEIRLGKFTNQDYYRTGNSSAGSIANMSPDQRPEWLDKKEELKRTGAYFKYSNGLTIEDLDRLNQEKVNSTEYLDYDPPQNDLFKIPANEYDKAGFDRHAKVEYKFKEGFSINTFVSTNMVQDLGKVDASIKNASFHATNDDVYVKFNDSLNVIPGDKFSIYSGDGEVSHKNSDRKGYRYTIRGHVKVLEAKDKEANIYLCRIEGSTSVIQRDDRITVYTPKIERLITTFNNQSIDGIIISSYFPKRNIISYGDIVYIDRGRADGVEMGNVFSVFGFKDRLTKKNITEKPTYKNGELTIISVTDNFATALVTNSVRAFYFGDLAITKSRKEALRSDLLSKNKIKADQLSGDDLKRLDVELNLDGLNNNLLDQGHQIELTDEELAELEKKEREKSVITDGEKDLESLEGLESEIDAAEQLLRESELDEDKLLEKTNLDLVEKDTDYDKVDSVDEIEEEFGKKYLDEDLNSKDNPYGLTEFDIEEIDELLNIEQPKKKSRKRTQKAKAKKIIKKNEKKSESTKVDLDEIDDLLEMDDSEPSQNASGDKLSPEDEEDLSELF